MSNNLEKKVNNYVNIQQETGKFYYAYHESAWILSEIMGYKLLSKDDRVGFPDNALNKVIAKLEDETINYIIYYKDGNEEKRNFHKINTYNKWLSISKEKIDKRLLIDNVMQKIEKSSEEILLELLEVIDDFYSKD